MKCLTTLAATAALIACATGTPALADSIPEVRTVTVHYDDLDTNSARGAEVLYNRIKVAAENVCNDLASTRSRSLALMSRYSSCLHSAISGAVAHVNRPAVSGYAAAHGVIPAGPPIETKLANVD